MVFAWFDLTLVSIFEAKKRARKMLYKAYLRKNLATEKVELIIVT